MATLAARVSKEGSSLIFRSNSRLSIILILSDINMLS